jgi:hypothetical protein
MFLNRGYVTRIKRPITSTDADMAIIFTHSLKESGTVPKTTPPYCTIKTCARTINPITTKNVGLPLKKGGIFPSRALQLIPFQTAVITNAAKNTVLIPAGVEPPKNAVSIWIKPPIIKKAPVTIIENHINDVITGVFL